VTTLRSGGVPVGEDNVYFDNCNEFINMINSKVMQHSQAGTQPPPPAVMVLTFSSPCMLSEVGL
jgi:hypothetical protein